MSLENGGFLPEYIVKIPQFSGLLNAEDLALDKLKKEINEVFSQGFIGSASSHLSRYEEIFSVPTGGGHNIDERRSTLIVQLNTRPPMTIAKLKGVLDKITECDCEVAENFNNYRFTIRFEQHPIKTTNLILLRSQVELLKPAHLGYDIFITQPVRAELFLAAALSIGDIFTMRQVN
ncbi:MAG: putative phage tail protein [Oscillospiraceae bacterium]